MNATSEGAKRTSGRYRVTCEVLDQRRPSFPRTKRVGHGGNGYRGDEPPFQEVRTDGDHEATERRQAEHQEGANGGAQKRTISRSRGRSGRTSAGKLPPQRGDEGGAGLALEDRTRQQLYEQAKEGIGADPGWASEAGRALRRSR